MPMALGHDGRIQKLTMRTPPNNENDKAMKSARAVNKNSPEKREKSEKNVA